jgi:hypothetical protein
VLDEDLVKIYYWIFKSKLCDLNALANAMRCLRRFVVSVINNKANTGKLPMHLIDGLLDGMSK